MPHGSNKPECRVLHIFSRLGIGGAETWLIALLRYLAKAGDELPVRMQIDVCLTGGVKGAFDEEAASLGAGLFYPKYSRRNLPAFLREFRAILANGRYAVIHDHQDYTAGLHFLMGFGLLPPVRIAHVHNPLLHIDSYSSSFLRKATLAAGRRLLARFATHIMGTSRQIVSEYGFDAPLFTGVKLGAAHCGFDVSRFLRSRIDDHRDICREFGFNERAKILLFVGRLMSTADLRLNQKNPDFAIEAAIKSMAIDPDVRLVMAGSGDEMRKEFQARLNSAGLQGKILLVGPRSDVPRLMSGAELLLLPSLGEGLGMVAVEAQAAGLRVLASDVTPRECEAVPDMVKFMPLSAGPSAWAQEALRLLNLERPEPAACNLAVKNSPFSIENSAARLLQLYMDGHYKDI